MATIQNVAVSRQAHFSSNVVLSASLSAADTRKLQRLAKAGQMMRLRPGIYVASGLTQEEIELYVQQNWQRIAGTVVPGGVVSHISAMTKGLQDDHTVTISHPTINGKKVSLPGLTIVLLRGPGPLPFDLSLSDTGLHWAGRTRFLLENIGKAAPRRAGREGVERFLVNVLNSGGERALNEIRDQAATLALPLGMQKEVETLRSLIGALLGTHARGELRTRDGQHVGQGTPIDSERMARFEVLAAYLRRAVLPSIPNAVPVGVPRHHFAFIESYFSNYVEGTKFDIDEAREIVLHNKLVAGRPKDSHDILGVFRLAITPPYRDSPPVAGADFLRGLEGWHAEMLRMRPEVNPGKTKLEVNYAGNTKFVDPGMVRGTMEEGSRLALSVPEGLARAIYYAFLISEVHPFEDGNGRLSRLVLNAELTRMGLHRVIIPTLYHPQYVDCARNLTRNNEPDGFVRSIAKMARWCARFAYADLNALIHALKRTNALEESPAQYRLLNLDGSTELPE
jgi:hypothetical protein